MARAKPLEISPSYQDLVKDIKTAKIQFVDAGRENRVNRDETDFRGHNTNFREAPSVVVLAFLN